MAHILTLYSNNKNQDLDELQQFVKFRMYLDFFYYNCKYKKTPLSSYLNEALIIWWKILKKYVPSSTFSSLYIFDIINHFCYTGDPYKPLRIDINGLYSTYLFMYVPCILYLSTSNLNISLSSSFEVLWKNLRSRCFVITVQNIPMVAFFPRFY